MAALKASLDAVKSTDGEPAAKPKPKKKAAAAPTRRKTPAKTG